MPINISKRVWTYYFEYLNIKNINNNVSSIQTAQCVCSLCHNVTAPRSVQHDFIFNMFQSKSVHNLYPIDQSSIHNVDIHIVIITETLSQTHTQRVTQLSVKNVNIYYKTMDVFISKIHIVLISQEYSASIHICCIKFFKNSFSSKTHACFSEAVYSNLTAPWITFSTRTQCVVVS